MMEQTIVASSQPVEQAGGFGRLKRGMSIGAVTNLDAFGLIFQQMAEGMGQVFQGEGFPGAEGDLLQNTTQDDGKKQDMTMSMQELAALMMSAIGTQTDIMEATPEQVESLITAMGQEQQKQEQISQNVQQAVASTEGQSAVLENGTANAIYENVTSTLRKNEGQAAASRQPMTDVELPATDLIEAQQVVERIATHTAEGERSLYDGQNLFQSAVEMAKRQMGTKKASSEDSLPEAMVADTATSLSKPVTISDTFGKVEQIGQDAKLAEQIDAGIKENLALGKREFTMKLKPESLGEITVKLVEKAGKTVLTISTASAQTARLINNDLAALREAVKPMAVEVHEAVSQPSNSEHAQMQQFNMSGQQFSQQQQHNFHRGTQVETNYFGDDGVLDEQVELEQVLESDGLDTYI